MTYAGVPNHKHDRYNASPKEERRSRYEQSAHGQEVRLRDELSAARILSQVGANAKRRGTG